MGVAEFSYRRSLFLTFFFSSLLGGSSGPSNRLVSLVESALLPLHLFWAAEVFLVWSMLDWIGPCSGKRYMDIYNRSTNLVFCFGRKLSWCLHKSRKVSR